MFTLLLAENGVDPKRDVNWKVYKPTLFGAAIDKGEIQAVAAPDPFAYILVLQGKATQVGNNVLGLFGNAAGLTAHKFCCTVALSGKLVRDRPKVAAALTRAWLKGSRYTGGHTHETLPVIETGNKYVAMRSRSWRSCSIPTTGYRPPPLIKEDILAGARSFKQVRASWMPIPTPISWRRWPTPTSSSSPAKPAPTF